MPINLILCTMSMVSVRTVLSHWCCSVGSCWLLFCNMNILSSTSKRYLSHTHIYLVINIKIPLNIKVWFMAMGSKIYLFEPWGTANCLCLAPLLFYSPTSFWKSLTILIWQWSPRQNFPTLMKTTSDLTC